VFECIICDLIHLNLVPLFATIRNEVSSGVGRSNLKFVSDCIRPLYRARVGLRRNFYDVVSQRVLLLTCQEILKRDTHE
jgi:hypothetical protein